MKIGKYELRKPWVKYVEIPLEKELYMLKMMIPTTNVALPVKELLIIITLHLMMKMTIIMH